MMGILFPGFSDKRRISVTLLITLIPAVIFVLLGVFLPEGVKQGYNEFAWVTSNIILAYSAIVLPIFLAAYFYFFDPRATTGGRLIFQFMVSLVGIIALNVIGIFINPTANNIWYILPEGTDTWRPTVRLVIYGFVAYSITSLAILLIMRKYFPHKLKTAAAIALVKVRKNDKDSTGPIDTVGHSSLEESGSAT
jgi:predicted permease